MKPTRFYPTYWQPYPFSFEMWEQWKPEHNVVKQFFAKLKRGLSRTKVAYSS